MPVNQDWILFKQGNQTAFERIYREQVDFLYSYGMKIIRDSSLVEDAIQDMFIYLWDKRTNLGDTDNYRAYLTLSLKRRIIKTLKKDTKTLAYDESEIFHTTLAIDAIIEKSELKQEQALKLKNAFEELNAKQQHILYLKYYQNFTGLEIAEILNVKHQSVRNGISRALSKLKSHILVWLIIITTIFQLFLK